jgi:hypothetical protein
LVNRQIFTLSHFDPDTDLDLDHDPDTDHDLDPDLDLDTDLDHDLDPDLDLDHETQGCIISGQSGVRAARGKCQCMRWC